MYTIASRRKGQVNLPGRVFRTVVETARTGSVYCDPLDETGNRRQLPGMTPLPDLSPLSDSELVELALADDQRAFRELFKRHHDVVLKAIDRLIGTRETVDDLIQETFIKAFRSLATY